MMNKTLMRTTLAATALAIIYSLGTTLPTRDCLTTGEVAAAQANAWQGVSLSCNEAVRLARLEARGLRISGVETPR